MQQHSSSRSLSWHVRNGMIIFMCGAAGLMASDPATVAANLQISAGVGEDRIVCELYDMVPV